MDTLSKITKLLGEQNKTQKDLTDFLGISKNVYSNWNGNSSKSYFKYIPKIADYFNCSVDYLLGRETAVNQTDEIISEQEKTLLNSFRQLNEQGREKCIDYLDDLIDTEKYKKHSQREMVEKQA